MAQLILTQAFSGRPMELETANIRSVTDYVAGPDAFGIARRAGEPHRDFPVAWIEYRTPHAANTRTGTDFFVALQSGPEVRKAMEAGTANLHRTRPARARQKEHLEGLVKSGVTQISIYAPFGTDAARDTWRMGVLQDMPVTSLIANLEAGRPLGAPEPGGVGALRSRQPRLGRKGAPRQEP